MLNSIDIIKPFVQQLEDTDDVQIIGGLGALAYTDETTILDKDNQELHADPNIGIPQFRNNGSRRDVDVLVVSSNPDRIREVEDLLEDTVGDQLERSVFGIHDASRLHAQRRNPLGFTAFKMFVSDRYANFEEHTAVRALFPFAVPLSAESLQPWHTTIQDIRVPVPSPYTTLLNYASRSIGGARQKDREKIRQVARFLGADGTSVIEEMEDATYQPQADFAHVIHSLHGGQVDPLFGIPGHHYSLEELFHHDAFMLEQDSEGKRALAVAAFKARSLRWIESQQWIVDPFQRHGERFAGTIVKNK